MPFLFRETPHGQLLPGMMGERGCACWTQAKLPQSRAPQRPKAPDPSLTMTT
ncbi:MAG: hypothetical protein ACTSRS_10595 [Candidatus Helarchaeota archaeon]